MKGGKEKEREREGKKSYQQEAKTKDRKRERGGKSCSDPPLERDNATNDGRICVCMWIRACTLVLVLFYGEIILREK